LSYVFLLIGLAGSGKTSCALSGEGYTGFHEFDPGSYERAVQGSPIDESMIRLSRHWPPLDSLRDLGKISVGTSGGVGSATAKHLKGWLENYTKFIDAYFENLEDPEVQQIVLDTETREWLVVRQAFLQQVQEAQAGNNKQEAERLGTLQYTEPNARQEQIATAAKMYGKDLILIGHMKEEWKNNESTGVMIHDGHKEAPNIADLFLEFAIVDRKPVATIRKAGAGGLELIGMKIPAPTLSDLRGLLDNASLIRKMGGTLPTPLTIQSVANAAKVFQAALI
jgi:hypothetical protein